MKYDDASWHYGGKFPEGQPDTHGGTHIGLFLRWCFVQGWAGDLHLQEAAEDVVSVILGRMTGTEFLFRHCDGQLTDEDLNADGNAFAALCYGDDSVYLGDYVDQFGELMYVAPESAHDYERLSTMLASRHATGVLVQPKTET